MLRRRQAAAAAAVLCLLAPAAPALASGKDVIKDCLNNGRLTRSYSQREYRSALANMPTDVAEYTDCQAIIRRAQLGLGGPPGASQGTGRDPFAGATPQEVAQAQSDIAAAQRGGAAPQRVGSALITPGALAYRKVSAPISELPTPLLALVVLILVGAAIGAGLLYRNRVRPGDPGSP